MSGNRSGLLHNAKVYVQISVAFIDCYVTYMYILVLVRHHNAMKMSKCGFPYTSQVYNKTVIALYLDIILWYLFCFYFDSANPSSKL